MYKRSHVSASSGFGLRGHLVVPLEKMSADRSGQVAQLAGAEKLHPEVLRWVSNHQFDFDRFVYSFVAPLGATEAWGCTVNGDGFEREHLAPRLDEYGHRTFELHARAYVHHNNKDPNIAFGDNPCMHWNPLMERAEGIWRLDRQAAERNNTSYVLQKIERGAPVDISMGTHVPYDVCAICGNKARVRAEYCEHPRKIGFGNICPTTGRLMQVLNPYPRFFDLSAVLVKAAPEAFVLGGLTPAMLGMGKVVESSAQGDDWCLTPLEHISDALIAGGYAVTKLSSVSSRVKLSDMLKMVPALSSTIIRPLNATRKSIPTPTMRRLKQSGYTIDSFLSSCTAAGVPLDVNEFRRAMGVFLDMPELQPEAASCSHGAIMPHVESNWGRAYTGISDNAIAPSLVLEIAGYADANGVLTSQLPQRCAKALTEPAEQPDLSVRIQLDVAPEYGAYLSGFLKQLPGMLERVLNDMPDVAKQAYTPGKVQGYASTLKQSASAAQAFLPALAVLSLSGQNPPSHILTQAVKMLSAPSVASLTTGLT